MMSNQLPYRISSIGRLYYSQTGVSPHSETTRATYTAPSTNYAHISDISIFAKRATAASTVGRVTVKVQFLIGGADIVNLGLLTFKDNTAEFAVYHQIPVDIYMKPGDMIRITTYDGSTGGTCDYDVYVLYEVLA